MNKSNKVIFFLRSVNDIDHIAPIIYKISKSNKIQLECILFSFTNDLYEDVRIQYLISNDIHIKHVFEYLGLNKNKIRWLFRKLNGRNQKRVFHRKIISFVISLYAFNIIERFKKNLFKKNIINLINEKNNIRVINFDHGANKFYKKITKEAKEKGIFVFGLPHGLSNMKNYFIHTNMDNPSSFLANEELPYNKVLYSNENQRRRAVKSKIVKHENTCVLGSPRYCQEWFDIFEEIIGYTQKNILDKNNKLSVLLLLTKNHNNIFYEEVLRIIRMLSKINGIELCVKSHTRGAIQDSNTIPENVLQYENDELTSLAIRKSDLVLFTSTSVIAECVIRKIPILYLRRTSSNKIIAEDYFNNIAVDTRDELYEKLSRFLEDKSIKTYTDEERNKFINDMICPHGVDVLNLYSQEILSQIN